MPKSVKRSQRQRAKRNVDYPDNWKEIATQVKELAGWRCDRCGHPHETPTNRKPCDDRCTHPRDGKQRMLTVHHLNMDKSDGRMFNLVALCQSCHLSIQARVDFTQSYMFELPKWIKVKWDAFAEAHAE